jgi:hypothetical protein
MSQGTRLEVSRRAGTMLLHATALQQGLPPQLGLRLAVPPLGKLLMSSSSAPVADGVPLVCSVGIDLEGRGVGLVQTCRWVLAAPATRALRGRRAAPARDDDAPRVAAEPHPCSHGCLPGVGVCLPSSAKARLVRTARDGLHARVDDEPRRVTHAATAAALTALQPLGVAYGKIYSAYGGEQQSVATPQAARGWARPTLRTHQEPILPPPWLCFEAAAFLQDTTEVTVSTKIAGMRRKKSQSMALHWFVQPVARSSESSERKLRNFS